MPDHVLRRCEFHLFRDKSSTDTTQVAVVGATLHVYRQGVVVSSPQTNIDEQEIVTIEVEDARLLQVGEVLVRDTPIGAEFQLTAISADRRRITIQNMGEFVGLAAGERLRSTGAQPTLFKDPSGLHPFTSAPTTDGNGYVAFYAMVPAVDLLVTGGGLTTVRVYTDQRTGWLRDGDSWLNARDFASIQAAIDSLPDHGGTVFIPAGTYTLTETLYTPCDRPCHLVGEGARVQADGGTVLEWTASTGMVRLRGDQSSLRSMNLVMMGGDAATDEHLGCGVFVGRRDIADAHPHPGTSTTQSEHAKFGRSPLKGLLIEDVTIRWSSGWGLSIPGHGFDSGGDPEHGQVPPGTVVGGVVDGGTLSFWVTMNRVKVDAPKKYGCYFTGGGNTTLWFTEGALLNAQTAVQFEDSEDPEEPPVPVAPFPYYAYMRGTVKSEFIRTTFEGNSNPGMIEADPLVGELPEVGDVRPWVEVRDCENILFESCYFENDPHWVGETSAPYLPTYYIHLTGSNRSVHIRAPHFVRGGSNQGRLRCLLCEHDSVNGLELQMPYAISVTKMTRMVDSIEEKLIDQQAVVLARPGQANRGIVILGQGNAWDASPEQGLPPGLGRNHPIWIAGTPSEAAWMSDVSIRVPTSTKFEREGSMKQFAELHRVNGALTAEQLSATGDVGSLMYWWGGLASGWRLVNNVPTLAPAEIAARDWVDGDLVIDGNALKLFIRFGGVWKQVASLA